MKLGIVVGHTANRPGAHSSFLQSSEYPWNRELAGLIEQKAGNGLQSRTFFRDGHGIAGAYRESDQWGSDITVELHFNSSDNDRATGCGVLYHPNSTNGKRWATFLCQEIREALDLPDWPRGTSGVVTPFEASGEARRGQTSLGAGAAPAALIEPFFGSCQGDCDKAAANKDGLAQAIANAATRYAQ